MNANSPSEALWQVLHQARALLVDRGFADPIPPMPLTQTGAHPGPAEGYEDLGLRYAEQLAFGSPWPTGQGSASPLAILFCEVAPTPETLGFIRSWFENPRVNLVLADHFFIQPLPDFSGDKPPYAAWAKDVCQLLRPKALLSLGAVPAQKLLGAPLSLESLRGSDYRFDRWSLATTLDPRRFAELPEAERPGFKAQVWKDLQRLLGKLKYG